MSQQSESALRSLVKSRKFWTGVAVTSALSLIFYDWYRDRYATPQERYDRIEQDYVLSKKELCKIRREFIKQMLLGLSENDEISSDSTKRKSCLKMLSSHVTEIPKGNEKGEYYTLDWGGSNYRVLRIEFFGRKNKPITNEKKITIKKEYMKAKNEKVLFNHLASKVKDLMTQLGDMKENENENNNNSVQGYENLNKTDEIFPIGFCFSFPMRQPSLDKGILIEWTKGFDVPNVQGKNVSSLMHDAFTRHKIPARIHSVVNDTVGTLLACAYDNDHTRIGLILGTGTNAAYIEPQRKNEIINIEWGNFDQCIPRVPIDWIMDDNKDIPNKGVQIAEKMMSGMYLGELTRLLLIEVFRELITDYGINSKLNISWEFKTEEVSNILEYYNNNNINLITNYLKNKCGLIKFNNNYSEIFAKICLLIINRSADLACTLLTGVLEKTGLFKTIRNDERNPFESDQFILNKKYLENENMYVTVGIDGSVYQKCTGYADRMRETMELLLGRKISDKVSMVHSEDGSGKGAALAAAAALGLRAR